MINKSKKEYNKAGNSYNDFEIYFREHEIYFSDVTCANIKELSSKYLETIFDIHMKGQNPMSLDI